MYDNVRFTVASALERERKKVNKTDKISGIKNDLKKHDDGSSFKEKYEEAKREHNLENGEGVIISKSLSNKIEENKELERLVEERLAHNPLLNSILNESSITSLNEEEEIKE